MDNISLEEIINQITEIDTKAQKSQQEFEKRKKDNEKKLKEICKQMEKDIIEEAKTNAEKKYKEEIEKCNILVKSIMEEGDNKVKSSTDFYEKIHKNFSDSIFKDIFEID
ncbi:MAG: hypothetical protein GX327_05855 [Epulopiscium sp.]|nr:hypothetical protein [Candidatus Epulonipiscium sp.]